VSGRTLRTRHRLLFERVRGKYKGARGGFNWWARIAAHLSALKRYARLQKVRAFKRRLEKAPRKGARLPSEAEPRVRCPKGE